MEPRDNSKRQKYQGGDYVNTFRFDDDDNQENNYDDLGAFAPLNLDSANPTFEEYDLAPNPNTTGDDEKRRIESLKRAIDMAKLMSNVSVENILQMAELVDKYLIG